LSSQRFSFVCVIEMGFDMLLSSVKLKIPLQKLRLFISELTLRLRQSIGCLKISDSPVGTTGNSPAIHCRVRKKRHVTDLNAMRPGNELPGYFQKSLWD